MFVGYARVSTSDQEAGLAAQLRDLDTAGCEKVFHERVSSIGNGRHELAAALDFVRSGDVLIVTKLDRLARSVAHLVEITAALERKKVGLRVLQIGLDTLSPTGKLMVNMLAAIAQFEVQLMKERQREGILRARAEGKYRGRKPTARAQSAEVQRLKAEGLGASAIAKRLGIGRASVYRVLAHGTAG